MGVSIVIPTRDRIASVDRVIRALDAQDLPIDRFEVIVTVDGPGHAERALVQALEPRVDVEVIDGPADGPAAARNRAIPACTRETVLWVNDDVVPAPDLVRRHIEAQASISGPCAVLGSAPWRVHHQDRVLDRLVRETSMVFFFDQMTGDRARNPDHDWGFRHAWTLNLSMPTESLRAIWGFDSRLRLPVYEDVEMAYRFVDAGGRVLYRPECVATHDHRYELATLVRRETVLGQQAVTLAKANPDCARAIFGFLHTEASPDDRIARTRESALEAWDRFAPVAEGPGGCLSVQEIATIFERDWKPVRAHLRALGWRAALDGRTPRESMDAAERSVASWSVAHAA